MSQLPALTQRSTSQVDLLGLDERRQDPEHSRIIMRLVSGDLDHRFIDTTCRSMCFSALKASILVTIVFAETSLWSFTRQVTDDPNWQRVFIIGQTIGGIVYKGRAWCQVIDDTRTHRSFNSLRNHPRKYGLCSVSSANIAGIMILGLSCQVAELFIAKESSGNWGRAAVTGIAFAGPAIRAIQLIARYFSQRTSGQKACVDLIRKFRAEQLTDYTEASISMTRLLANEAEQQVVAGRLISAGARSKDQLRRRQAKVMKRARLWTKNGATLLSLGRTTFRAALVHHFGHDFVKNEFAIALIMILAEAPESVITALNIRSQASHVFKALFGMCAFIPNKHVPSRFAPYLNRGLGFAGLIAAGFGVQWLITVFKQVSEVGGAQELDFIHYVMLAFILGLEGTLLTQSYGFFTDEALEWATLKFSDEETQKLARIAERLSLAAKYVQGLTADEFFDFLSECVPIARRANVIKFLQEGKLLDLEIEMNNAIAELGGVCGDSSTMPSLRPTTGPPSDIELEELDHLDYAHLSDE